VIGCRACYRISHQKLRIRIGDMNLENGIALGTSCTTDQKQLIDDMDLLDINNIIRFLFFGSYDERYGELAQRILDNRYTFYGWKDYMYCYMNSQDNIIDYIIDHICSNIKTASEARMLVSVFTLLYSPVLVLVPEQQDKYSWRYFSDNVWIRVDKLQVKNMLRTRAYSSNIGERLGMTATAIDRAIESACVKVSKYESNHAMFAHYFEQDSNNKEDTFCMPSCTYDMKMGMLRKQLPGDLCTLSGSVDPDTRLWEERRSGMIGVLSEWMGGVDVVDSYLNILSGALSEFGPRYAVINSGTGADGKSTFFHIVSKLFGGYCFTTPSSGPAIDTKGANDATPVANAMISRRVYITTDASNLWKLLASPGFKSMTGGDTTYIRRLYKEASSSNPRLKALVLINTNQADFVATSINELTRIRIVKWSSKRITDEDRDIIPKHQSADSGKVTPRFENVFIRKYGGCMMMELIHRHMNLTSNNMIIDVCPKIRQWTKDTVAPKTILRFMHACTQKLDNSMYDVVGMQGGVHQNTGVDDATSYALSVQSSNEESSLEQLFMVYAIWRKTARFSATDPTTVDMFKTHLEFYYPISKRIASDGIEQFYIKGITLRPDVDVLSMIHPMGRSGMNMVQLIEVGGQGFHRMSNHITYTES
jgi:hypothetical protein